MLDAELGHWENPEGAKTDLNWDAGKKYSALQSFSVGNKRVSWGGLDGVCTVEPIAVTRSGTLAFAGSTNRWTWAVVAWPKEKFPIEVASQMSFLQGDPCDPDGWFNLWTNPVPGALAFAGSQPVLWKDRDDPWCEVLTATGGESRTQLSGLKSVAPEARKSKEAAWRFSHCASPDYSHDSLAIEYGRCLIRVGDKYAPLLSSAKKQLDEAKTEAGAKAAANSITRLEGQESDEESAKCGPTAKKIATRMNAACTRLVDWHGANVYKSHLDVMQLICDQDEAQSRPTASGKPWGQYDWDMYKQRLQKHRKSRPVTKEEGERPG